MDKKAIAKQVLEEYKKGEIEHQIRVVESEIDAQKSYLKMTELERKYARSLHRRLKDLQAQKHKAETYLVEAKQELEKLLSHYQKRT